MVALALVALGLGSCTILPKIEEKTVTTTKGVPDSGPLVKTSRSLAAGRKKGESSFLLLDDAGEALKWRLALIDSARSTIDIQLYLWHGGASSELLLERAIQAADRGVRVRILVDDFLLKGNNVTLATLCRNQANFDIRIFNPGRVRGSSLGAMTEMLANFSTLNRRMHNKTFTVDGCMTIVGGRNIGDHYYGMDEDYNFIDLDVLASGPVVAEVSEGFDAFWNDPASFPGEHLSKRDKPEKVLEARAVYKETMRNEEHGKLKDYPIEHHDWSRELAGLKKRMVRGRARFVQDDPDPEADEREVVTSLRRITTNPKGEIQLASPYLIPSDEGLENVARMCSSGKRVQVLVPSLAANNHAIVDGHYRKYRKRLVDGGSELSEFRADPTEEIRALADVGSVRSERVTLHLKAVVGDRNRCFIGSLNLDPRAVDINTESGMLIESPALAGELGELIETLSNDQNSWRVTRDEKGRLQWQSRGEVRHRPPPAKWAHRLLGWIAGWLPIEGQI
ncbi:phospholipase D family protein [Haloferula sp.]|uniref:phospholipase D family protein n=1 Tax=Haloferula sp. TaxID=2497595 RepID=UPI00329D4DC1